MIPTLWTDQFNINDFPAPLTPNKIRVLQHLLLYLHHPRFSQHDIALS